MPDGLTVNLRCRVVGSTAIDPAHVRIHVEWYDADDPARALRPDLIAEAEDLERRAAVLRADALFVPDQFDSLTQPHPGGRAAHAAPEDVVGAFMRDKRDPLSRNLGVAVTPIDPDELAPAKDGE